MFSSRVLWVEYNCTLHGPRVSWNAIHATVRMRPGRWLDKHGCLWQWIEFCFHHVPIIVYLWLTVNLFLNFYLSSSSNWLREEESNLPSVSLWDSRATTTLSRGNTYIKFGTQGEIWTHDFTDLQSVAFDHSATCAYFYSQAPRDADLSTKVLPLTSEWQLC